jgi:hypothetical protein
VRHWISMGRLPTPTIWKRSIAIYQEDAVLECPQSGGRTRGRSNIQKQRASQPSKKRFAVRRIISGGDLGITELIITYDGKPSYSVSILELRDDGWTHNLGAREFANDTAICG